MRRADMDADVWYAIDAQYATRAGRIIDPGTPPGKVLVVVHRNVYAGGDRDTVGTRTAWLSAYTDGDLVDAAIEFERTGRNTGSLEAMWVGTGNVLRPWDDYCGAMFARQDQAIAERKARDDKVRADRLAVAARWRAVAPLVDLTHPDPRHTIRGAVRESELIPSLFEYDEHGRTSHVAADDSGYMGRLAIYEAWAADRALLAQGCAA